MAFRGRRYQPEFVEAESQALKQTVEALAVRLRQQAEMLDGLSRRKRSGLFAPRIALVITILLGGSIAVFRGSGHVASFGSLQRQMVGFCRGGFDVFVRPHVR